MIIHRLSDNYRAVKEEDVFYPQVRYVNLPSKHLYWGNFFDENHQKVRCVSLQHTMALMQEWGCDMEDPEIDASVEQAASLIAESGLLATYTIEIDRIEVYLEYTYVVSVAQFPDLDQWLISIPDLVRIAQRVMRQLKYRQWLQSTKRFARYDSLFISYRNISACSQPGTTCPHQHMSASYHGSGSVL